MEHLEIQAARQVAGRAAGPGNCADVPRAGHWSECARLTRLALMHLAGRNLAGVQETLNALLRLANQTCDVTDAPLTFPAPPPFASRTTSSPLHAAQPVQGRSAQPLPGQHRVVIRALGEFELTINGIPIHRGRKPPRKPLELLKALIARGDTTAGAAELGDCLWPDAEGDAALDSLRVALYRLRRLLTFPHAVIVQNATLRLNPHLCWVDAWVFEQTAKSMNAAGDDEAKLIERLECVLEMYRGHLFAHESEQSWMLAPRARLRQHWLDAVYRVGTCYQAGECWGRACRLYEHACECDPGAEELYRRLMICQCTSGNCAEALHTYRRCRNALIAHFGIAPSAETERLRWALTGASGAATARSVVRRLPS